MGSPASAPRTEVIEAADRAPQPQLWRRLISRPAVIVPIAVLIFIWVAATLLPPVLGLDPFDAQPSQRLQPPSGAHFFGTDNYGRDVFARVLAGATTSLSVGATVAVLSAVLGTAIGVISTFSSVLDNVLMRICDGIMAIPSILLAVALAAALGPSTSNLIIALTIVYTPAIARLVRSRTLTVSTAVFVEASRSFGARPLHQMVKHLLPNSLSVIFVQATFTFAESIIVEAALSFLGAGVPAPAASWGNILYDGKSVIGVAPQMIIFTSLALVVTVVTLNRLGDGLRDVVDPRASLANTRRRTRKRSDKVVLEGMGT